MTFPEKLDRLLKQRGLSARALARALKLSNATVAGWLKGADPQPAQAKSLVDHLNISFEALFDDKKPLPFDERLAELRSSAQRVQEAYPGNPEAQQNAMDLMDEQKSRKRQAARLRKLLTELCEIASELDPLDEDLHQVALRLRERGAHNRYDATRR